VHWGVEDAAQLPRLLAFYVNGDCEQVLLPTQKTAHVHFEALVTLFIRALTTRSQPGQVKSHMQISFVIKWKHGQPVQAEPGDNVLWSLPTTILPCNQCMQ
jgi:hypothetical protein